MLPFSPRSECRRSKVISYTPGPVYAHFHSLLSCHGVLQLVLCLKARTNAAHRRYRGTEVCFTLTSHDMNLQQGGVKSALPSNVVQMTSQLSIVSSERHKPTAAICRAVLVSEVGAATAYRLDNWAVHVRVPRDKNFRYISSTPVLESTEPSIQYVPDYISWWNKGWRVEQTAYLQLVSRPSKRGFIHSLPHTPSWPSA
jgi:hypothetical protein